MSVRTRITSNTDDKGSLLELFSRVVDLEVWSYQTAAACRRPLGSRVLAQIWKLINVIVTLESLLPPPLNPQRCSECVCDSYGHVLLFSSRGQQSPAFSFWRLLLEASAFILDISKFKSCVFSGLSSWPMIPSIVNNTGSLSLETSHSLKLKWTLQQNLKPEPRPVVFRMFAGQMSSCCYIFSWLLVKTLFFPCPGFKPWEEFLSDITFGTVKVPVSQSWQPQWLHLKELQ